MDTTKEVLESAKNEPSVDERIESLKKVLARYTEQRAFIGSKLKRIQKRLDGATVEVVKRRFAFDLAAEKTKYDELQAKIEWAQSLLHILEGEKTTGPRGQLIHRPFAGLASLLA